MELNDKRVLVGMSGGVDSSTSAIILQDMGYEVIGVTIEPFYFYEYYSHLEHHNPKGSINDAKEVCDALGIKHIVVDYFDHFKKTVVNDFVNEYLNGRTPNPCAKCNPIIKWGKLLQTADDLGAKYIATGHYAIVEYNEDLKRNILKKGKDYFKDQSYFLWGLSSEQLSRTLFPLGNMTKMETRKIAEKKGLRIFNKSESQEVCFIADNDYRYFIKQAMPAIYEKIGSGDIIYRGTVVGSHSGYPFYTVGQRKGLGITHREALYVKKIDAKQNVIEVAGNSELYSNSLTAHAVNLIKYDKLDAGKIFNVRVRYRDSGSDARCILTDESNIRIEFINPKRAISPGQSAVIYEGDDLVGGGVISS